jgi:hypothetical protein
MNKIQSESLVNPTGQSQLNGFAGIEIEVPSLFDYDFDGDFDFG